MDSRLRDLLRQLYLENQLASKDILYILNKVDDSNKEILFNYAEKTVLKTYQKKVYLRALLEFSNYCRNNCYYCGIRNNNREIKRYRLSVKKIIKCCLLAYQHGYRTFVLQSGEDDFFKEDILIKLLQRLKSNHPEAAITLSIGEYPYKSYQRFYQAGADRFLLRHESISKELYKKYHPDMSYSRRLQCLKNLKKIGYQVGAGFIVGLPGQTNKILTEELLFLKKLNPDMVGIGPLIPHPKTPLAGSQTGSVDKTLLLLSLIRLLLPETLLPVTTAVNTLDKKGWEKGLKAGANVIMPVISPAISRGKYEIYQNKGNTDVSNLSEIKKRVERSGFKIDMSRGDSLKCLKTKLNNY
ncbi:[FeFe] hydrogenase H-cluster radical SAM maturase HydE [Iocasia frigidifontis]|uniref:[FeFe] hydrogenase H-cluster radical SAM maturase HydE n=1 Tax=Iocasia fonsfrigidae TaxID=2682810 RepID=A0A8A7KFC1_9FIRM|nr:[FeFe] hydrogenase H-cluster radical SAM maturase HydE [Iocasia fonsfrigidae]QTL97597.1 [FeFe] hydrogenase H-cluster radical SAM maturase HydE [Iocasia fonsfrigidae]